ncbi:MAG: ABC transporter ATP-binding protein [Clostridia bacterium]
MITVENLYHSYKAKEEYAVKDISFHVSEGEVLGFLGPSGAGKSTTQNVLTGLLTLQKGNAVIAGVDVRKPTKELYNSIGVSFESPNLYGKLTGYENLDFHRKLYDVETEDPLDLLRMVGLYDDARKKAQAYSRGMKHRLVFARSMLNRPKIWFLDEPTTGLDPTTANSIKNIIKEKNKAGTTIFLTTHNMHVADELCHRVAFINEGKLLLVDSPRNLKLKYGQKSVDVEYTTKEGLKKAELSLEDEKDRHTLNDLITGGQVEMMHTKEATLEEIFIKVTGRGLV